MTRTHTPRSSAPRPWAGDTRHTPPRHRPCLSAIRRPRGRLLRGVSELYAINTDTGAPTLLTTLDSNLTTPFAFAYQNGVLYTASNSGQFGTLSPTTGAFTLLANLPDFGGITSAGGAGGFYAETEDLFNSSPSSLYKLTADGHSALIGAGTVDTGTFDVDVPDGIGYGFDNFNGNLYSISLTTGADTLIGPTGLPSTSGSFADGMAYDARNRQLYLVYAPSDFGVQPLYDLNTTTGLATAIGSTVIGGFAGAGGINTSASPQPLNPTVPEPSPCWPWACCPPA